MNIACYNIRGLNSVEKQVAIKKITKEYRIPLFGVIETRTNCANKDLIMRQTFGTWLGIFNYSWNILGRIWVCGNPAIISVQCMGLTDQIIHCFVTILHSNATFMASFVYGLNQVRGRRELWENVGEHL